MDIFYLTHDKPFKGFYIKIKNSSGGYNYMGDLFLLKPYSAILQYGLIQVPKRLVKTLSDSSYFYDAAPTVFLKDVEKKHMISLKEALDNFNFKSYLNSFLRKFIKFPPGTFLNFIYEESEFIHLEVIFSSGLIFNYKIPIYTYNFHIFLNLIRNDVDFYFN